MTAPPTDDAPRTQPPVLLPQHQQLITGSAITPSVAIARGYRSVTRRADLLRLGFKDYQARTPALLIPIHSVHGEVVSYQLRPDDPRIMNDKPLKYETPAGSRMALDVPPASRPWLGDPKRPLFITEGVRKADAAVSRDLCCVGVIGVWNWRGTNGEGGKTALADWEAIALNDRPVYLVFDSDVMTKPAVHNALARLKAFLASRGADVLIVYLPAGPGGAKQGLDDFFAAGHSVDDLLALASSEMRPIERAAGDDAPGSIEHIPSSSWVIVTGADGVRRLMQPAGRDGYQPVTERAAPVVLAKIEYPADEMPAGQRTAYEIAFAGRVEVVTRAELVTGDAWERFGSDFAGKGKHDNLAQVIFHLAEHPGLLHKRGVRSSGWYASDCDASGPKHHLVLPDGSAIGAGGRIENPPFVLADMPEKFASPYRDPDTAADAEAQREALAWLATITRESIGPLAFAANICALLYDVTKANFALGLFGLSTTGKTWLATWLCNLLATYTGRPAPELPASFSATVTAIEEAVSRLGSVPLPIDDFTVPPGASESEIRTATHKAELIVRAGRNRAAIRPRMVSTRRGIERQPDRYVRTVPTLTGERFPPALASLLAGTFILPFENGSVDLASVEADAERHAAGLRAFGYGFVSWIAGRRDREGDAFRASQEADYRGASEMLAARLAVELGGEVEGPARRLVENGAHLLVAASLAATFAQEQGWVSPISPETLIGDLLSHLVRQAALLRGDAAGVLGHEPLGDWAAGAIREALAGRKMHVKDSLGGLPIDKPWPREHLGYRERDAGHGGWEAQGVFAGNLIKFEGEESFAFTPDILWRLMRRAAREDKRHTFPESAQELWKQLHETGLIAADSTGKGNPRPQISGARERRVVIALADLRPDDDEELDDGPEPSDTPTPDEGDNPQPEPAPATASLHLAAAALVATVSTAPLSPDADEETSSTDSEMLWAWFVDVHDGRATDWPDSVRAAGQRVGFAFDSFKSVTENAALLAAHLDRLEASSRPSAPPPSPASTRTPKMRRGFRYLPTAYLDPHTGIGIADAAEEGAIPLPIAAPAGDSADGSPLTVLLAHLPPHIERVYLSGERPGDGDAAEMYRWFRAGIGGDWERGRMFIDADYPVLRLTQRGTGRKLDIRRAATWFGEGDYTAHEAREAMTALLPELRQQQAFSGARLLTTPGMTGLDLWDRTHSAGQYPPLSQETQLLIAGTSGQGRIELCTLPEVESVPRFSYVDGRFMYSALTKELGTGLALHDDRDAFAGFQPGRYRVRATVPLDWGHLGLLPLSALDSYGDAVWRYPATPGEVFETWADGAEIHLAMQRGWSVTILERILLAAPTKGMPDPLEVWTRNLVTVRNRVSERIAVEEYSPAIGALIVGAVRNILLHGIGAFASRGRPETIIVPDGEPLPGDAISRRFRDGVWLCTVPARLSPWTEEHRHPEWAATVWARARRRLLAHPVRIGSETTLTGALAVPRANVLALRTDALYLADDPGWPDPGRNGVFRLKGALSGPATAPHDWMAINALRDRAEIQYRTNGGA